MDTTAGSRNKLAGGWDFANVRTDTFTHGLHPYPAKMVPSIARELIACYSAPGDLVYDPFCGSGTTLVEASLTQRRGSGIDLNPLAVLLSKVKTSPLDPDSIRSDWVHLRSELLRSTASTRRKRARNPDGRFLDLNY